MSNAINPLNTNGIIFYALPYQDNDLILHVFTEELGLIKTFIRNGIKYKKQNLYSPFYELEWLFKPSKGEMLFPKDSALISQNLHLREDFALMQTASHMLQAVKMTHPYWKSAPRAYLLLKFYLEKMKKTGNLKNILSSFYLKILQQEGLLALQAQCSHCGSTESTLQVTSEGVICSEDIKKASYKPSLFFTPEESAACFHLAQAKSWNELENLPILPVEYNTKIKSFFEHLAHF
ncbi:MAG: DNA repair protein RecO [Chlamydiales bacterium]|nr:DNA repair protein RecO [Chlamydiales bacterium]NCF70093.1 DNA repair protein RecO [Chlamydiales bacterium]